jgi:penicillin-binding protein 1A
LYAAAFENDYTPATLINDAPIVFEDANLEDYWRPKNSSGKFYGPTRLREALLQSRNVVSIRLLQDLGLNKTKNYLTRFGFEKDELPNDLSLALGSYGLSPLQNASYFSVFANGGKSIQPFFIEKILKTGEEVQFLEKQETNENFIESWVGKKFPKEEIFTIDPRVSYIINDILLEATRRGTGKKIQSLKRDDFAGKTGTTNDAESTWFTGFNKNILTTVWFGYDQPSTLGNKEFGSSTALPIWLDYMEDIIDDVEYGIQTRPSGLIAKKISLSDGMPANPEDSKTMFELFLD